jgi:CHAT domain-containing protein/tetratricopeptide (TPR) repeat protein
MVSPGFNGRGVTAIRIPAVVGDIVRCSLLLTLIAIHGFFSPLDSSQVAIAEEFGSGVIVETVVPGSAGDRAGVRPGDILTSWGRSAAMPANPSGARGVIRSPFDLAEIAVEQAPRGVVTLEGTRGDGQFTAAMPPGDWGISSRPRMAAPVLAAYREGSGWIGGGEVEKGIAIWRRGATLATRNGAPETAAWLSLKIAMSLAALDAAWQAVEENREQAHSAYATAVSAARDSSDPIILAQALEAEADGLAQHGAFSRATEQYLEAAQARARVNPQSLALAQILRKQARAWREAASPSTPADFVSRGYTLDAEATSTLRVAAASLVESAKLTERLAPQSLALATILNEQALVAARLLDLEAARRLQQRALAIEKGLVSGSPEATATRQAVDGIVTLWRITADSLMNAGGNFIAEQAYLLEVQRDLDGARQIFERLYPGCDDAARGPAGELVLGCRRLAHTLNNLGMVAAQRGNPGVGQRLIERARLINEALRMHQIFDKPSPSGGGVVNDSDAAFDVSRNLNNLGTVAWLRGDLDTAADYFTRALDTRMKCGTPCAGGLALTYRHLARVATGRLDLDKAADLYREALKVDETALKSADPRFSSTPLVRAVATGYKGLADVAYASHDYAEAQRLYMEALSRQRKAVPKSLELAETLVRLGMVARDAGNLSAAEALLREAITVANGVVPDSPEVATAAHTLGTVLVRTGRLDEAATYYSMAITALESESSKLGGAEDVRSRFVAQRGAMYYDYIKLLVDRKDHPGAFQLLERSRAQSLRALLAERDLVFREDVPAALDRERRQINSRYEKVHALLQIGQGADQVENLRAQLRALRDQRQAIADRIRETSPRLAAIEYPQPLAAPDARQALDPGTVLLSYAVGETETLLFILQPSQRLVAASPDLEVFRLPIGRQKLQGEIRGFQSVIDPGTQSSRPNRALVPAGNRVKTDDLSLEERGTRLFDTLIRPAYQFVAASTRVLISADGPLHALPFGALIDRAARPGTDRYLIEWKPVHTIVSATVYAEVRKRRWSADVAPVMELVAFGDPDYSESGATTQIIAYPDFAAIRQGRLSPLPGTRAEVERVSALYTPNARVYLGRDATEERLKEIATRSVRPGLRYLHIASHGLLDDQFPLDSALALSTPATAVDSHDNGLLQAWEIYEQLRIDADLVTLSACETGFGEDIGGEGLISLSRAFLYAGAHSVLASLWRVNDDSTADLMARFYTHLKAGRSKDEALRAAQIDFIRRKSSSSGGQPGPRPGDWSHPYHWAGFSIVGDWR